MKRRYIIAVACIALCLQVPNSLLKAQSASVNYIKTTGLMTAVTNTSAINNIQDISNGKRTTITYFDGLGRTVQEVVVAKSPDFKDKVQHFEYDILGRTPLQYLPYTAASQAGEYHSSSLNKLQAFYSGNVENVPYTNVFYAETEYELSPLNRVRRTASPGEAWALNGGYAVGYDYGANDNDEVINFKAEGNSIINFGYIEAGKLHKNSITDEAGNISVSYTNQEALVVLKRTVLGRDNFADTYYVYNSLGLLVCVIMPQAVKTAGIFSDFKNAFQYKYDERNRLIRKQIPGADSICYVYNKANLLVAEQDGNMRKSGVWKYYKYDRLGRIIIEGLLMSRLSRIELMSEVNSCGDNIYESRLSPSYTSTSFPFGSPGIMITSFYDDYNILANNPNYYLNRFQTGDFSDPFVQNVKGLLTVRKTSTDENTIVEEVFFYDSKYRIVQHYSNEYVGHNQIFITGNFYHFNGAIEKSNKRYVFAQNQPFNYSFSYFYDHDWRLTSTQIFFEDGYTQQLTDVKYNELSNLDRKYLHGGANDHLLEQSFQYNIRGWLTDLGNIMNGNDDVYFQRIYYESVPQGTGNNANGYHNGNICAIEWKCKDLTEQEMLNGYVFSYDSLSRLTNSVFYIRNLNSGTLQWAQSSPAKHNWGRITGIGSERNIQYDKNGNILRLSRTGRRNSSLDELVFDSLSYTYNGNRLIAVNDAINGQNSLHDFPGFGSGFSATYTYDQNGNVTNDPNRNLGLNYNHLNLPVFMKYEKGGVQNTYTWDGMKRRRRVLDEYGQIISDERYFGDLVVENGQPFRVLHPDGYIDVSRAPVFYYHIKDHLGNVRAVIQASPGNTSGTLVQATDYYPFGMAYTIDFSLHRYENQLQMLRIDERAVDEDSPTITRNNPYLYNGKEQQPMPGKWLDYGARFYDAQIGRFHSVDPLAEQYASISPYAYCANNPVLFIDPDGREIWIYYQDADGNEQKLRYTQGMNYKGGDKFVSASVQYLNQMSSTKSGSQVLGDLISSKNAFNMTNTFAKDEAGNDVKGTLAFAGSDAGGGQIHAGELLNEKLAEGAKLESIAHEFFHGYQHENAQGGASIFNEVEAMVFSVSVSLQYSYDNMTIGGGSSTPLGRDNSIAGQAYQDAFRSLLYNTTFPKNAFVTAVKNFKQGAEKNISGLYNNYPLRRPNQTKSMLGRFYPLIK